MLPTTYSHVCLQCHRLSGSLLPRIIQHLSGLLINKCFHNAEDLVTSTLARRDIPAAQGSNNLFEFRRSNDS